MSIRIDNYKCTGCGKCIEICPGGLIYKSDEGKAYMKYPNDCWGCAACLKECGNCAVSYYIGADAGGSGTYMHIKQEGDCLNWHIIKPCGERVTLTTNRKESNKY